MIASETKLEDAKTPQTERGVEEIVDSFSWTGLEGDELSKWVVSATESGLSYTEAKNIIQITMEQHKKNGSETLDSYFDSNMRLYR